MRGRRTVWTRAGQLSGILLGLMTMAGSVGCASRAPRIAPGPGVAEPTERVQRGAARAAADRISAQEAEEAAALEAALLSRVDAVIARAAALEGERRVVVDGQAWRADCSGFVAACYGDEADLTDPELATPSVAETMWRTLSDRDQLVQEPRAGDLVFFDDTYDRNRNGARDDPLSHVGLVESVDAQGTVVFLHFGSGRVKRDRLNLEQPGRHEDEQGEVLNSWLRRGRSGERLAGQLCRGFARPLQ